jgi:molybdopterin molybdotransferase
VTARDTSWPAARALAYDAAAPLPAARLPVDAALGATLARPLVALTALPAFDTAAMDGYAVAGAPPWRLTGRIVAGEVADDALLPGTAVEVATGAMVPAGTRCVVPYEMATLDGDCVNGPYADGRHVRPAGEESVVGRELAPSGTPITPVVLGLAAASGHDELVVVRRPTVALLVTGSELLTAGLPGRGHVRDAVGPMLPGLVRWLGGAPGELARVPDDPQTLAAAVGAAAGDVIVTSGASSIGRSDHLHRVLRAAGAELLVDGVAVRPGHPQLLARLPDGRWVVGLPGNPLAALAAVVTLLQPLLRRLAGRSAPAVGTAVAADLFPAAPRAHRLAPAVSSADGVRPVGAAGPAMLTGVAQADGFAVVPPADDAAPGAHVGWLALPPRD